MKIHHLNCGTFCPIVGKTLAKKINFLKEKTTLVCHCLLIELPDGLVLIDTGLGVQDVCNSNQFSQNLFLRSIAKPMLDINETAFHQIVKLGFSPNDVKHIIVTHLDSDHAGGIEDFPNAMVHLMEAEWIGAYQSKKIKNMARYFAKKPPKNTNWAKYNTQGETWNGFDAVKELKGLPAEILLIPLPGHTDGHAGIAINNGAENLFFVGDSYMHRSQLLKQKTPAYIPTYNKIIQTDLMLFTHNLNRLSELQDNNKDLKIFCSHDRHEFNCMCSGANF
jgi:glyoxylase-like metal-dependent hydrolase (beta-lactamase superfamily II)